MIDCSSDSDGEVAVCSSRSLFSFTNLYIHRVFIVPLKYIYSADCFASLREGRTACGRAYAVAAKSAYGYLANVSEDGGPYRLPVACSDLGVAL